MKHFQHQYLLLGLVWLLARPAAAQPAAAQPAAAQPAASRQEPLSVVDGFNYTLGTQTIGASYQFTAEPKLVETARAIRAMGSNTLKFSLALDKALQPQPRSLAEITRLDPSVKAVLAMPFASYVMWAYPLSADSRRFQKESLSDEYREMYDLTRALLTDHNRSGKSFYLGNWEGDWHLLHLKPEYIPSAAEIENMAAWARARQKAVDDARRDTPHQNVQVFYYLEVNRVVDAIAGKPRLANQVLASVNPDFVSYSSYDALGGDAGANLKRSLDFIESKLAPKTGIEGKRVFIGEYGFPALSNPPEQQERLSRRVMRAGLSWGCPFVLYWELFNNEVGKDGRQRGFWLIDDKNIKQPVYFAHQRFYEQARRYVAEFLKANKRPPTRAEFIQKALPWLDDAPATPPTLAEPLSGAAPQELKAQ